jgi:hypothetical protein
MNSDRTPADASHAMTTALRYHHRAGRFGREVCAHDAAEMREPTPIETKRSARDFEVKGYVVDAVAVAQAIVERLVAGRVLRTRTDPGERDRGH